MGEEVKPVGDTTAISPSLKLFAGFEAQITVTSFISKWTILATVSFITWSQVSVTHPESRIARYDNVLLVT